MFFRLALGALLLSSCSLRFNDQVSKPIPAVNTGAACLADAGDVIEHFANGTLSEKEHDDFYACATKAIQKFSDHTVGRQEDSFAPDELGAFLTRAFLKGKVIQPGLLAEAMALKQALIGGPGDKLSKKDLANLVETLATLRAYTGKLRPLMPLTVDSFRARGLTSAQVEEALVTFRNATEQLGESLHASQGSYHFDHLANLMREVGYYLYAEEVPETHWTKRVSEYLPVIRPAKALLLGAPREAVTLGDWPKVYFLVPRLFSSYLRAFFYAADPWSRLHGAELRIQQKIFTEFLFSFRSVIDSHPGKQITSAEIADLLRAMSEQKLLHCRADTARQLVRMLFGRLFSSANKDDFVITRDSLARLNEHMTFAFEGLYATEALYRYKHGDRFLNASLTRADIAAVPTAVLLDATWRRDALSAQAVRAVQNTVNDLRVVMSEDRFGVVIPKDGEPPLPYAHMVKAVGLRALNRLLLDAFGNKEQLSPAQLDEFLDQVFPILVEYGILDEKLRESVNKRVREASLFLYSSDGNLGLTMPEGLEFEALLLSTIERAPKMHKKIAELCQTKIEEGKPILIEEKCYREKFTEHAAEFWSYLPGLAEFVGQRDLPGREAIFDNLAKFLRKDKTGTPFTNADSQSYILLPYYLELLFYRFDTNRDGFLDNAEAEPAYAVFQPFLAEKANAKGFTNAKDHAAIYNFLLANRALPTDAKWSFLFRRYLLSPKSFRNDRAHVIEIFEKLLSL